MKITKNKITPQQDLNEDEHSEKKRKLEETKQKKEEYQELIKRQSLQKNAAQEATKKLAKKKSYKINSYYLVFAFIIALCLYPMVIILANRYTSLDKIPVIDEGLIDKHNSNSEWQQNANKIFESSSLADAKRIINTSFSSRSNLSKCNVDDSIHYPDSFDYREQWYNCVSFIKNQQGTCGSSYAIALTQALSDRMCILNNKEKPIQLSSQELISCDIKNSGCKGGYLDISLNYMKNKGLVEESCFPYEADSDTVKCRNMCKNRIREKIQRYCVLYGEDDIKRDIYRNGPVVSVIQVYVDFLTYKSGIYRKGDDVPKFSGNQAVTIVGWGVENNPNHTNEENKFWIIKNSWGQDWGENGYARIAFGQDLIFEQYAYSLKLTKTNNPDPIFEETKSKRNWDVTWDLDDEKIFDEE